MRYKLSSICCIYTMVTWAVCIQVVIQKIKIIFFYFDFDYVRLHIWQSICSYTQLMTKAQQLQIMVNNASVLRSDWLLSCVYSTAAKRTLT